MGMNRTTRIVAALGALALIPAGLAACGAGGQSTAEACEIVNDGMQEITASTSEITTLASEQDVDGIMELASKLSDDLAEIEEQVTNEEVGEVLGDLTSNYNAIIDAATQMAEIDPTADDAMDKVSEYTDEATEAQTGFNDATQKFSDVCNA